VYATCKLTDGVPVANSVNGRNYNNGDVSTGTLFSAIFYSPNRHIDGFLTWGNLGADGACHARARPATNTRLAGGCTDASC
jgi:hypothetical protein